MGENLSLERVKQLDKSYSLYSRIYKVCLCFLIPLCLILIALGTCIGALTSYSTAGFSVMVVAIFLFLVAIITYYVFRVKVRNMKDHIPEAVLCGVKDRLGPKAAVESSKASIPEDILLQTGISDRNIVSAGAKMIYDYRVGRLVVFDCATEKSFSEAFFEGAVAIGALPFNAGITALAALSAVMNAPGSVIKKFDGSLFIFSGLKKVPEHQVEIRSRNFGTTKTEEYDGNEPIQTESIEFNQKFKIFAASKEEALYVLTPQIILKLNELDDKLNGDLIVVFKGNNLTIGLDGKHIGLTQAFSQNVSSLISSYNKAYKAAELVEEVVSILQPEKLTSREGL